MVLAQERILNMANGEYRVDGKVALVTGAGRGIGKAIALMLARAGADVIVSARTKEQIENTTEQIRKLGRNALPLLTDVSQQDQVGMLVKESISHFGKIDILCNNAGIFIAKSVASIPGVKFPGWEIAGDNWHKQLTLKDWNQVIATNLTSVFLLAQAVGPHMISQKRGKIINITSVVADEGMPYHSAYAVSKAGVSVLTRCLASEWAPFNINVNAIAPGEIDTEMLAPFVKDPEIKQATLSLIPLGRLGEPRDIALLALFLASNASDYITGQILTVDGGGMGRGAGL
ncbi:SDR family NAD(P)-dependent oxidoreductase [Chloroflexota bacterium]